VRAAQHCATTAASTPEKLGADRQAHPKSPCASLPLLNRAIESSKGYVAIDDAHLSYQ